MEENTYRHTPGAPGVREPAGGLGQRGAASAGMSDSEAAARALGRRFARPAGHDLERRIAVAGDAPTSHGAQQSRRIAAASGQRTSASRRVPGTAEARTSQKTPGAHGEQAIAVLTAAPAATYWRRRFVVLAIALVALAGVAWSLSESPKVHASAHSSASSRDGSRGHGAGRLSGGSSGGGSHAGASHQGNATGAVNGGATSHAEHSPGPAPAHSPAPEPSATAGGLAGVKPALCSWHSIVLGLSASQILFGPGRQPKFSLSVVSTQPADCSFNVGPSHLAVVIKEGPARIWSSADCIKGSGSRVMALSRGVPSVIAIAWNKTTSSPGCAGPVRFVPAGSYTAYAMDGSLVSAPVTVLLS
jgi:hypothetical protein